jgi:molecular chaperone GrpE
MKKPTIAELEKQVAELTEALQRERADAINLRRRAEEEKAQTRGIVKGLIVGELLPILDSFDRAAKHTPKELKNNDYVKGVQGIIKQFEKALKDLGVEKIKTVGEVFDPSLHEAVQMEEGDGNVEKVCEELQSGYIVDGNVIRHAMVKVRMEQ